MSAEKPCQCEQCKHARSEASWARWLPILNALKWPAWIFAAISVGGLGYTLSRNPPLVVDIIESPFDALKAVFSSLAQTSDSAVDTVAPYVDDVFGLLFAATAGVAGTYFVARHLTRPKPASIWKPAYKPGEPIDFDDSVSGNLIRTRAS